MWARFLCLVFGHRLFVVQNFGPGARRVGCRCCDGDWAMHDGERAFVKWDGQFTEMYESFGYRVLKR
jgi:hypothetical protein